MLLVPGLGLTAQAGAQSLNIAHGFYVQTTGATSSGAIRLASMKPRGPTFSDRVSYPRYLGGYGIGVSARKEIETRTGARTRSMKKRWSSRHDQGFTRR
ncbi:MAG: hypothetical protein HKN60_05130 [Rhizobiales bacterium]|nr:hypothetical protein [Hyphomicrobiales bacterium]